MKRFLSSVLSLLCIFALISSAALPAAAQEKKPIVVAGIGDSIMQGYTLYSDLLSTTACNMPNLLPYTGNEAYMDARDSYHYLVGYVDNAVTPEDIENNRVLTAAYEKAMLNAFPVQVAMSLNLTDAERAEVDTFDEFYACGIYESLSCNALRSRDLRAVFDSAYYARLEREGFDALWNEGEVQALHRCMTVENITSKISKADILLYSVSEGDFYYGPQINTNARLSYSEHPVRWIISFAAEMAKGVASWLENTPIILEKLREINPDLTVVLTGAFNFLDNHDLSDLSLSLSEDAGRYLVDAATPLIAAVNQAMRSWADKYENVIYVDITGVETNGTDGTGDDFHPSAAGHQFIVRRILSALPSSFVSRSRYDITVDLADMCGGDGRVTSVLVNGKACRDYTQNGYSLTVHYDRADAVQVAVTVKNGSTSGITLWQTAWNSSDGYRTYSFLRLSDSTKLLNTVKNKVQSTASAIKNKLNNLFRR